MIPTVPMPKVSELEHALVANGYLGSFRIDHVANSFNANRRVGPMFHLLKSKALEGVKLSETDKAFHPEDLDFMRRVRRQASGPSGRRVVDFRVIDVTGKTRWLQSHGKVTVDRYGSPIVTSGFLFDISELKQDEVSLGLAASYNGEKLLEKLTDNLARSLIITRSLKLEAVEKKLELLLFTASRILENKIIRRGALN